VTFTGAVGAGGQTPAATDRVEAYMDYTSDPNLVSDSLIETQVGTYAMIAAIGGEFAESFGESSNRAHVVGHGMIVISRNLTAPLPIAPLVYVFQAATTLRWLRSSLVVTKVAG
jgi:hypothetical protein